MATTIYFNSRVTSIPGSYSEVDASGLAKVGLGASGIVACIGEAEGGEPGIVQRISNPGKVGKIFRSGDLLEGGTMLFDPSKDPDIPGGAQEIMFVKVNPATQSTLSLPDDSANPSIDLTSKDYGAFTEKISVDVSDGTNPGTKAVQVSFESVTETFDNLGEDGVGTLQYTGSATTSIATYEHAAGLSATVSQTLPGLASDLTVAVSVTGASTLFGIDSLAPDFIRLDTTDALDNFVITIYGIDNTGAASSEDITLGGGVMVTTVKSWQQVLGVVFTQACVGSLSATGDTSGDAIWVGTDSVGVGLDVAPNPYELVWDTTLALNSTDGAATGSLMIVGVNDSSTPTAEVVVLVAGAGTTTTVWSSVAYIFTGGSDSANQTTFSGPWTQYGTCRVSSSDPFDTARTVSVYGLDSSNAPQSETIALDPTDATTPVTSAGTWNAVLGVAIDAVAIGEVSLQLGSGPSLLDICTVGVGDTNTGLTVFDGSDMDGDVLNWNGGGGDTTMLVIGEDASGAAMELVNAPTGTTTTLWTNITGFALLYQEPAVTTTVDYEPFDLTPGAGYEFFEQWEDFFTLKDLWTLTKTMPNASSTYELDSGVDEFIDSDATGTGAVLGNKLYSIAAALNAGSAYVSCAISSGAKGPPANTVNALFLAGGSEGSTSFSDWQAALDALRDYRVNTIMPLTTDEAVHAATIAHCTYMCAAGRSERDCVLGAASMTTLLEAKALALAMNTRHARLLIQDIERFNTSGVKEQFAPPFTSCIAAGMQAGSDVGTSLTFKYLNILDAVGDDATYTIQDDGNELIQAGLCMIEKVPNRGQRWLRNVTTYLIDNNLAYCEASVNEAVNYSVYNFRTTLEAIVGRKGFAGTVTAAQGLAVSILGQLIGTTAITSWRNLTITLTDDVMTVDVEIAPVIPVNFIKTTIHLVSASFEATT